MPKSKINYFESSESEWSDDGDYESLYYDEDISESEVDEENVRYCDENGIENLEEDELNESMVLGEDEYYGKDGFFWASRLDDTNNISLKKNYLSNESSQNPLFNNYTKPVDYFSFFIDHQILNIIYKCTNQRLDEKEDEVTITEIRGFIGLLILFGVIQKKVKIKDIWDTNSLHFTYLAKAAMTRERFKRLCSKLAFDELEKRETNAAKLGKLFKIAEIFEIFRTKIKSAYEPDENLCIDETLYPFRGKFFARQYIPSKPAKYGMKFFCIVDVRTFFLLDTIIYCGKENSLAKRTTNVGEKIVLKLSERYFESGRTITVDNFFTTIPLAQNLWKNGLMLVGTLRSNKTEIPIDFKPNKYREQFSSLVGYNNYLTLVSYVPKPKKSVILLSSKHHEVLFDKKNKNKPDIINYYNKNKCGVDILDKMIGCYSCKRKTRRWTMCFFMYMIDVASHNAVTLYQIKRRKILEKISDIDRRLSLESLAIDLIKPLIEERVDKLHNFQGIRQDLIDCFRKSGVEIKNEIKKNNEEKISKNNKSRCVSCPREQDRKTNNICCRCELPICLDHSYRFFMCKTCYQMIKNDDLKSKQSKSDSPAHNLRKNNR